MSMEDVGILRTERTTVETSTYASFPSYSPTLASNSLNPAKAWQKSLVSKTPYLDVAYHPWNKAKAVKE